MNISEGNDNYSACNMSAYNNIYDHFVQPDLSHKKQQETTRIVNFSKLCMSWFQLHVILNGTSHINTPKFLFTINIIDTVLSDGKKKRFCFAEKGYLKQTKSKWYIDIYAKIDTCLSIPNVATKTLQLHFMFIYSTIWSLFWFFILKIFQYLPVYWISYKRSTFSSLVYYSQIFI